MVFTRLSKSGSKQSSSSSSREPRQQAEDVLDELLLDLSEFNKDPDILVPLSEKIRNYEHKLAGNSFMVVGPASCGKESHVLWLAKDVHEDKEGVETHLITIDCRIYETDYHFLNALTREMRIFFGESVLSKHIVINQATINLTGLNKEFQKLKKKQLILIIKSAEILAAHRRKQRILYNIFEWLNNTDVKKYITILMLTRNITFLDKLEKRTRSRMNMPILYLQKIKPKEVVEIIRKRIEFRIDNCNKKNAALLEKLLDAFENNKELMRTLEEHYEFCPRDITVYLKIMKLIITLDIQTITRLENVPQAQLNSIVADRFSKYCQFTTQYKNIAKNLFASLSLPDILLLGFIRQRLMNQEGRLNTEITLKILMQDYNAIRQKKNIFEGGTFCNYQMKVLEEALLRLQDENFITVGRVVNLELFQRSIVTQYSPDDLLMFFREYEATQEGVPSFITDIYHSSIHHE